jgi:GST-like protein
MFSGPHDLLFHTFLTPNCLKVSILLEELALPYRIELTNMFRGDQFKPAFVQLNPNAKIPVLRNLADGMTLSESNAILLWLAEGAERYIPTGDAERRRCLELLFLQASSIGPTFGLRTAFMVLAEQFEPGPARRFMKESERLTDLTETLLGEQLFLLGSEYSIVDIAFYPWFYFANLLGFPFADRSHLTAWYERISSRPGVQRGLKIPFETLPPMPKRQDMAARLEAARG